MTDEERDAGLLYALERRTRMAVSAAYRMQAATLRSSAELLVSQATTLEGQARALDEGADFPAGPVRLAIVEEPAPEREPEEEPAPVVQGLAVAEQGGMLFPAGGGDFSEEMLEAIDSFGPRFRGSEFFVPMVNRAAEEGLPISFMTMRQIADWIREAEENKVTAVVVADDDEEGETHG